jgi:1-deoxy-D-xylulose-5-phosphate synthase
VIASPKDEQELRSLVRAAFAQEHPFALHYPRDPGFGLPPIEPRAIPVGQAEVLREGDDILFVGFGPITMRAVDVADELARDGWSVGVVNARFAKPLDRQLLIDQARGKRLVVTFEESVVAGGFGSAVLEAIEEARLTDAALRETSVRILGIPADRFVDHGAVADLRRNLRLDVPGLAEQVLEAAATLDLAPSRRAPIRAAARAG